MKVAIVHKDKCLPEKCANLCARLCPVNRKGENCIEINVKAKIEETACIGCGICQNRCPFGAISITNLPSQLDKSLFYRYGKNGFCLYGLPTPKVGVLGLLGRNGVGKSTALNLLSGKLKINLGQDEVSDEKIRQFLQGSELLGYFDNINNISFSVKPQNLSEVAKHDLTGLELIKKFGDDKEIENFCNMLKINFLDRKLAQLSGGELQKLSIAICGMKNQMYIFLTSHQHSWIYRKGFVFASS
ncbi:MAG: ATP-binding cassette domain-containing protein [archaeon]